MIIRFLWGFLEQYWEFSDLRFPYTFTLLYKSVSNHFCSGGGGGGWGLKSICRDDCFVSITSKNSAFVCILIAQKWQSSFIFLKPWGLLLNLSFSYFLWWWWAYLPLMHIYIYISSLLQPHLSSLLFCNIEGYIRFLPTEIGTHRD